jgi:ubiquinone/menaquinone biosynthesis C-methylase UbiE
MVLEFNNPLMSADKSLSLTFTGERFLPDQAGEMWNEHWHRYHYVRPLVAGKRVLDVACGEGYGSRLLAGAAANVTGVDIAKDAITHARATYASQVNLAFIEASCTALPLEDAAFDVVVSFETIEHITEHDSFLDEVKRVLTPNGVLMISSPNKAEYTDAQNFHNEFHVKELYRDELQALLASRFKHLRWHSQRNGFYSMIAPEAALAINANPNIHGHLQAQMPEDPRVLTVSKVSPHEKVAPLPALYFIVFASNDEAALNAAHTTVSAFTDAEEFAMHDYKKIYRDLVKLDGWHRDALAAAEARDREHAREIAALRAELETANQRVTSATLPAPAAGDSWLVRLIKRLSA